MKPGFFVPASSQQRPIGRPANELIAAKQKLVVAGWCPNSPDMRVAPSSILGATTFKTSTFHLKHHTRSRQNFSTGRRTTSNLIVTANGAVSITADKTVAVLHWFRNLIVNQVDIGSIPIGHLGTLLPSSRRIRSKRQKGTQTN